MLHQNTTDETLVMLTLAGEQCAYEVLVVRYQRAAILSAMSVTRNQFMAEDAAQDAFVTAWMKLNTLQEPQKFGAWVCRIAKNCALNMIGRYRSFLPLDLVENLNIADDPSQNPAELYALSEERNEVNRVIDGLPEKVRKIIHLHYFQGLSIAEIADRMRISEGTVKWQLHDGRKRIRKGLCAMNEKYNDTLVQRVMKKVEELKLWQMKNDKSGFAAVYQDVLREVEELPESKDKHHALADVLMRGWWWLPGKKNDALFARIADAAMQGKNEEVMTFIVAREDSTVYGGARIEFIRDKQIPRLEKAGFVTTLGREWFWLGYGYFREGKAEEGKAAYARAEAILERGNAHRVLISNVRRLEERLAADYRETDPYRYRICTEAEEYRLIDGKLRYWSSEGISEGYLLSADTELVRLFRNSAGCDGHFFADLAPGEQMIGSDGTTLTYASAHETVDTPAGRFENCQLWVTRHWDEEGKSVSQSYYKEGVGIVRYLHTRDGITDACVLSSYRIKGGSGLLPFAEGNTWEYTAEYNPEAIRSELQFTVSYADSQKVMLSSWENTERLTYDTQSWLDMIQQIRNEYAKEKKDGNPYLCDVSDAIERAETLAKTPMELAHTRAAATAARRIFSTDPTLHPDCTTTGHWNFFSRNAVRRKNGSLYLLMNSRWSFEWKNTGGMGIAEDPILYNDIYGILQDATNCIWSDEWHIGASAMVEYTRWSRDVRTQITCEEGGTITTKAGTFENCFRLCLDIGGMTDGWSYRGGKKVYDFAQGIGIVRMESEYCDGARTAVYELTDYRGRGEGYMPMCDGMMRRYEAQHLTDGFVGAAEYTYVADEEGDIIIFTDRTGIRELPPPITQYGAIQNEVLEERLWNSGKREESRLQHDLNNFYLLCHFFGRPSRTWAAPEKAVAWNQYRLRVMEGLGSDNAVPKAWLGHYASTTFRTACALFGCGRKEEGYQWLDKAFAVYPEWDQIPDGTELDTGDPMIYGGIKVIKGKGLIKLPDGSPEPLYYTHLFQDDSSLMYYGLTAPHGWEWFNPVRGEERFKEYIARAKELADQV